MTAYQQYQIAQMLYLKACAISDRRWFEYLAGTGSHESYKKAYNLRCRYSRQYMAAARNT